MGGTIAVTSQSGVPFGPPRTPVPHPNRPARRLMPTSYPAHRPSSHTLNEADTCRVHITPALLRCGWGGPPWRIKEQHYFTDGQIILVGNGHRRQRGKKSDYLLRYQESFPIAVVEAKAEDLDPLAGSQQAKGYAPMLGLYFAYSSNGHGIAEWDFTTNT